jgi:hypothetical protein
MPIPMRPGAARCGPVRPGAAPCPPSPMPPHAPGFSVFRELFPARTPPAAECRLQTARAAGVPRAECRTRPTCRPWLGPASESPFLQSCPAACAMGPRCCLTADRVVPRLLCAHCTELHSPYPHAPPLPLPLLLLLLHFGLCSGHAATTLRNHEPRPTKRLRRGITTHNAREQHAPVGVGSMHHFACIHIHTSTSACGAMGGGSPRSAC